MCFFLFAARVELSRPVVLKLFQKEAPLCRVNSFVAPQKKTHDENIFKLTILLTNFKLYQKQMNLYNAGTTILFVA